MRKSVISLVLLFVLLAVSAAPALAITGTYVKDNEHPFVGLAVFYDASGEFVWRCSGTLLSPTVFLTAGHCADTVGGAVTGRVYFQQDAGVHYDPALGYDPVTGYPESCAGVPGDGDNCRYASHIYNFEYPGGLSLPNTHDAGIMILDNPITMPEYGELPAAGVLDALATARGTQDTTFTISGYGLSYKQQPQNGKPNLSFRERLMADSGLTNLRSHLTDGYNLQTQGNGDGRGGTCNGDSGGPVFLGDAKSNKVVAVTSFGMNSLCRGTDFAYRVDRPEVLAWINKFMPK
jgi:hypothetical protein